jgi:nitroimidazol reductase NimA-like FMN-containing flavoprotein (pyridoxamine 5'-phosphate oxidase superfamily)
VDYRSLPSELMRKREKEVTDRKLIDRFIDSCAVIRLGLHDGREPYVVPLCFGRSDDWLYMHCAREGRKLDIIKKHPEVCFELDGDIKVVPADGACEFSARYTSVIGYGKAVIVDGIDEKRRALNVIMSHYSEAGPFEYAEPALKKILIIALRIRALSCKSSGTNP